MSPYAYLTHIVSSNPYLQEFEIKEGESSFILWNWHVDVQPFTVMNLRRNCHASQLLIAIAAPGL